MLADALGVRHDWKGSNDMWRNALSWKGTPDECIKKFGCIPSGAWLFTLKQDGGEIKRGYKDGLGNAAHVGIYTGMGRGAMHSSTGGVAQCAASRHKARHSHRALPMFATHRHLHKLANYL